MYIPTLLEDLLEGVYIQRRLSVSFSVGFFPVCLILLVICKIQLSWILEIFEKLITYGLEWEGEG